MGLHLKSMTNLVRANGVRNLIESRLERQPGPNTVVIEDSPSRSTRNPKRCIPKRDLIAEGAAEFIFLIIGGLSREQNCCYEKRRRHSQRVTRHIKQAYKIADRLLNRGSRTSYPDVKTAPNMLRRLCCACLAIGTLCAQSFDVASIRPQAPDDLRFLVRQPNGGHFTAEGVVGKLLVMLAYDVRDSQITGGPAWFATEKWDIEAKCDDNHHSAEETKCMLQKLLENRFSLKNASVD
jgi:hypothetical protein